MELVNCDLLFSVPPSDAVQCTGMDASPKTMVAHISFIVQTKYNITSTTALYPFRTTPINHTIHVSQKKLTCEIIKYRKDKL